MAGNPNTKHRCIHEWEADAHTWRCPDEIMLAAFVDDRLPDDVRRQVETHLAHCSFCTEAVSFLVREPEAEFPEEAPRELVVRARALVPEHSKLVLRPVWSWATVGAAAAGLVLFLSLQGRQAMLTPTPTQPGLPPVVEVEPPARPPAVAGANAKDAVRKQRPAAQVPKLVFPRDGGTVSANDVRFRWERFDESLFYEVRLVTAEGDLVWTARTETQEIQLPAGVRLIPGEKYFIWVLARLPEGKAVKSPAIAFRVGTGD